MPTRTADDIAEAARAMLAALYEAREFIDDHVDVLDGDDGQPRPNRAMNLLPEIDAAIAAAEAAGITSEGK